MLRITIPWKSTYVLAGNAVMLRITIPWKSTHILAGNAVMLRITIPWNSTHVLAVNAVMLWITVEVHMRPGWTFCNDGCCVWFGVPWNDGAF